MPVGPGDETKGRRSVEIVDYEPTLRSAFRRLNVEWLQRWFTVEPIDEAVMGDPEHHVLAAGGHILFAMSDGEAVGTVALRKVDDGVFELTKMAVAPDRRGGGIGRQLLAAALERFASIEGRRLFLESNDRLEAAVRLYESVGFVHRPAERPLAYGRGNVFMEWEPPPQA